MYSARLGRATPVSRPKSAAGLMKSRTIRFTFTGSRASGDVARALQCHELATKQLGQRGAGRGMADPSSRSVDDKRAGSGLRAAISRTSSSRAARPPGLVAISVCGSVSSAQPTQSSICLVEWGSVNTCEKKNCEEVLVVVEPVVAVELLPALIRVAALARTCSPLRPGGGRRQRHGRADEHEPLDPLGVVGRQATARAGRRIESDTSQARSVPVASITASASAANSPSRSARARLAGRIARCRARRT